MNTIVAELLDSWQNIDLKFFVRGDSHLWTRDTDCTLARTKRMRRTMSFVDLESLDTFGRMAMLELIRLLFRRVPESSVVNGGDVEILSDPLNPGWQPVDGGAGRCGH